MPVSALPKLMSRNDLLFYILHYSKFGEILLKKIVIGILAHVDAGKTTLSEELLYHAGEIRRRGRVDHGDAFLDNNEIERDRGITIFSKPALLTTDTVQYTLVDTPGHVDFSAETERAIGVLDYAVLVVSGTDGVQSHTETIWKLLNRYRIPAFVFVNKMDISERTHADIIAELKQRLGGGFVDFSDADFYENTAMYDERIMEKFLDDEPIPDEDIRRAVAERLIVPCRFGSALKSDGAEEFLSTLDRFVREPKRGADFGARVYKIAEDEQGTRLTYMKITGGALHVRDIAAGKSDGGWREKVTRIRVYSGAKYTLSDTAEAGTVCAVEGLTHTRAGDGLGTERNAPPPILEPVLSYSVKLPSDVEPHTGLAKLKKLEEENPELHIVWNERTHEIQARLMGEVQLDVLKRLIYERYGMEAEFGEGSISYRETIAEPVEGIGHYEPLRHYAEVHLLMEPLPEGSGLVFDTACSEDVLDRNWQRLILTHLAEKTHLGVLTGSPITDMKITLIAGRAHLKHTEGGDFRQATYRAVRHGLRSAESVLLEPWYDFRLELPSETVGRAMTDVRQMGGECGAPEIFGDTAVLSGSAPVAGMRGYSREVVGYTRGRGRLSYTPGGYKVCADAERVIEEIGYDCDADIENTADSVFCSHGAGYAVKWDEVKAHAHIDTGLSFGGEVDTEPEMSLPPRAALYSADENELKRIFERTYGEITHKNPNTILRTQKTPVPVKYPKRTQKTLPDGPEYLLVDGYNIIFAWDELAAAAKDSLEFARGQLINMMCNYQGYKQCELILVFDAYKVKGNPGEIEKEGNITVVYTKEAETADMYIEKVTREIGKKHRVRVATSDNLEQIIIMGGGAVRVSADAFKKEYDAAEAEIRNMIRREF